MTTIKYYKKMSSTTVVKIKILKSGILTNIQDEGRYGNRYFAIPQSGYMDSCSANMANLIVGNDPNAGIIECNIIAGVFEFLNDAIICITGADMQWTIDGRKIYKNKTIKVNKGQQLKGKNSVNGMRAYIAVAGDIQATRHYKSMSTYHYAGLGGINGRRLQSGDILTYNHKKKKFLDIKTPNQIDYRSIKIIEIMAGPEWSFLSNEEQIIFLKTTYIISENSNRMGAKLESNSPIHINKTLAHSHCIIPGMIQLPPNGDAIVILADGQTTGGYPRIAYIPKDQLNLFNQIMPKQTFRFCLKQNNDTLA